jgi:hypothetical protein
MVLTPFEGYTDGMLIEIALPLEKPSKGLSPNTDSRLFRLFKRLFLAKNLYFTVQNARYAEYLGYYPITKTNYLAKTYD